MNGDDPDELARPDSEDSAASRTGSQPVGRHDDTGLGPADVEAAWADIVARLSNDVDATRNDVAPGGRGVPGAAAEPAEPATRPVPEPITDPVAEAAVAEAARAEAARAEAARRAELERRIDALVDGPDGGHFVPPAPRPLPPTDLFTLLAWVSVVVGPLVLLGAAMAGGAPLWLTGGIAAAVIAGFVALVARMPSNRDDDDDGAVV